MKSSDASVETLHLPALRQMPLPIKALISATLLVFGFAMMGALGQIVVHDIIPTFFEPQKEDGRATRSVMDASRPPRPEHGGHGDLFGQEPAQAAETPAQRFYKSDQFVWTLKWTHIHLFGMNMIFILMGPITLLLSLSRNARTWLIFLPFVGVFIVVGAVWLKGYVSPMFFWLHIPGGLMFGTIFVFVALQALREMWLLK